MDKGKNRCSVNAAKDPENGLASDYTSTEIVNSSNATGLSTSVMSNHTRQLFALREEKSPCWFLFKYSLAWKSFPQENNTRKGNCQSLMLRSMVLNTSNSHYVWFFAISQQAQSKN